MQKERIDDQNMASLVEGASDASNESVGKIHDCGECLDGVGSARYIVANRLARGRNFRRQSFVDPSRSRNDHHISLTLQDTEGETMEGRAQL